MSQRPRRVTPWLLHTRARAALRRAAPIARASSAYLRAPPVGRALAFCGGVALVSYGTCAAASASERERVAGNVRVGFPLSLSSFFAAGAGSDEQLAVARAQEEAARLGAVMRRLKASMDCVGMPARVQEPVLSVYLWLAERWLELSPQKKAAVPVVAANACVFAAWHVRPLAPHVARWFVHRPCTGRVVTLATAVFSHRSAWHFALNNIALWSVGSAAVSVAGACAWPHTPEASPTAHFLAFFVTAGTFAMVASQVASAARFRVLARGAGLLRTRQADAALARIGRGSLGSSGAVYAALVLSALTFPQATVSLIVLPLASVPIQWGVAGMVALDVLGLVRGWRTFDHAAHLGGALFGVLYYVWGPEVWERAKRFASGKLADRGEFIQ